MWSEVQTIGEKDEDDNIKIIEVRMSNLNDKNKKILFKDRYHKIAPEYIIGNALYTPKQYIFNEPTEYLIVTKQDDYTNKLNDEELDFIQQSIITTYCEGGIATSDINILKNICLKLNLNNTNMQEILKRIENN